MFSVVEFWSVYSLLVCLLLALPFFLGQLLVNNWLGFVTRDRIGFTTWLKWMNRWEDCGKYHNTPAVLCSVLTLLFSFMYLLGCLLGSLHSGMSLNEVLLFNAGALQPVGLPVLFVLLLGGSAFTIRKVCDKMFAVKEKLDKL